MATDNPPQDTHIRVAVVEGDPLRTLGYRAILGSHRDIELRTSDVRALLKAPDDEIVLMTTSRGAAFYAAMTALKSARPAARVLVVGETNSDLDILRALGAGAKGYLAANAEPDEFVKAIRALHAGSVWAPGRVLAIFIDRVTASTRKVPPPDVERISQRQQAVLRLLAAGLTNREIAVQLSIGERTVKAHVAELMRKVGAQNRMALSVHAITHALLTDQ